MESSELIDLLKNIDRNLTRLLAIFEYLHRDIVTELDRKEPS